MPRYCDPSSPCSSAVTAAKKILCGGFAGASAKARASLQQNPAARAIVRRAVVDVVALQVRIDPQVVVVRRVDHGLVGAAASAPGSFAITLSDS